MLSATVRSSTPPQQWTVLSLIEWASAHMREKGFDESRLHVELLLAYVLQLERIHLYTNFDRPLNPEELAAFKTLFLRRLAHEPLQYIIGETSFMGFDLFVDKNVLIPRPETELLVERVVEYINRVTSDQVEVLDIGTGSGNIPVALAKFASKARITSVDVSAEALAVAARNIKRHAVNAVTLIQGDIFGDMLSGREFDLIISNPPYISLQEFQGLQPEVRDHEPRIATTDEDDGFKFIRRIAQLASLNLKSGGAVLIEIAYNQSANAMQLLGDAGLVEVECFPDYAGIPRIVKAVKA
ncbi:MAG: peptide chain release factor N(5)-glutamine methyltransferase [Bacteroidota bacterium]